MKHKSEAATQRAAANISGVKCETDTIPAAAHIKFAVVRTSAKAKRESQTADNKALPWTEFANAFSKAPVGQKDGAYILRGECNGHRSDDNMQTAILAVIDGDSSYDNDTGEVNELSAPAPESAKQALDKLGVSYVVHTSHSHMQGEKGNRWRALIPLSRPVTKAEWPAINTAIHTAIQQAGCPVTQTKESGTFSQPWYLPRIANKSAPFEFHTGDGNSFAVDKALAESVKEAEAFKKTVLPAYTGNESVIGAYNARYSVFDMLLKHGYLQKGNRWLSPDSTSGEAGVNVSPDGKVIYSHGSSDALATGNSHDAFSIYRVLECNGDMKTAVRQASAMLGLNIFYSLPTKPTQPTKLPTHADIDWQHPMPLTLQQYPPAPDKSHMPGIVWDIVKEIAESRQTSTAVCYPTALACVCTVLRGKLFVTRSDFTQTELVTLYLASVADSGEGKSSTRAVIESPCKKVAREIAAAARKQNAAYSVKKKAAVRVLKGIETSLAESGSLDLSEADEKTICDNQQVIDDKPKSGLLICSEITPEGFVDKLEANGFIAVLSGEGAGVLEGFGKYSSNSSPDAGVSPFLSAYDNETAQNTRRGDNSYGVDNARACLSLGLQPYALAQLWCNEGLQGRGFINRLTMFDAKPHPVEYHKAKKPDNSIALNLAAKSWAGALDNIDKQVSVLNGEDITIALTDEADNAWADFAQKWHDRTLEGGDLWHLSCFFKKRLQAQVLRIAAVYHAIEGGSIRISNEAPRISLATMQKAINAGNLIGQHFIAISKSAGFNPTIQKAKAVLARIHDKKLTEVTAKVIYDNGWAGVTKAETANEVLSMLVDNKYLYRVDIPATGKGRPPAPKYLVNPLSEKKETLTAKPDKPAKIENEGAKGIKTVLAGLTGKDKKKTEMVEYDEVSL